MVGIRDRVSCREYFRELKILLLQSQYISLFVINNKHNFKVNSEMHNINARTKVHPPSHLSVYEEGTYYAGIKVFNSLPVPIKDLAHNTKQFKSALNIFLYFCGNLPQHKNQSVATKLTHVPTATDKHRLTEGL
jgi:hypothetical protein